MTFSLYFLCDYNQVKGLESKSLKLYDDSGINCKVKVD